MLSNSNLIFLIISYIIS